MMHTAALRFSVIIPTYNRWHLLPGALRSIQEQGWPNVEIIVVDDHSTQPVPPLVALSSPTFHYVRQPANLGPGCARNRGLESATHPWVLMLDDDDRLLPGALDMIAETISTHGHFENYPVFQFAHQNGSLTTDFRLVRFDDYLAGAIRGDFLPVIQRDTFFRMGFRYPDLRIGGEHLLWWKLAQEREIPTWSNKVARFDRSPRAQLTSWRNQANRALEYAEMQERCLAEFGSYLKQKAPDLFDKKSAGAAAYWLLCGRRDRARTHLDNLGVRRRVLSTAIRMMSVMPPPVIRMSFGAYRVLGYR